MGDRDALMHALLSLAEALRDQKEGPVLARQRAAFFNLIAELERQKLIDAGSWTLSGK